MKAIFLGSIESLQKHQNYRDKRIMQRFLNLGLIGIGALQIIVKC